MHMYNWKIAKPFAKQYLIILQGTSLNLLGFYYMLSGAIHQTGRLRAKSIQFPLDTTKDNIWQ